MLITENSQQPVIFCAGISFIICLLFLMGITPLHFWYTESSGKVILPIFVYFIMIEPLIGFGALINISQQALLPLSSSLQFLYQAIGLMSITIGAIGACSGKNVRKTLAYGSLYHLGLILLLLQQNNILSGCFALIYLFIYILSVCGICLVLFGLKIRGEYLFQLEEFTAIGHKKPFMAAMMTIFLLSLLGMPPCLGFLGNLFAFNLLAYNDHFWQIVWALMMLAVLAFAYLQIIKTFYFEDQKIFFDRTDKGIYIALILDLLLMIWILYKPQYLAYFLNFSGE